MGNHLENFKARRLERDPFFVACPLKLYAKSEGFGEETLAASLKCSKESLLAIRLCAACPSRWGKKGTVSRRY